jgi:Flp pilus assembly protein TadG
MTHDGETPDAELDTVRAAIPVRGGRQRQRGAIAVVAALCLITMLGFTALTVDLGNNWARRRGLITATDAAALAVAQDYALGGAGCAGSLASTYVVNNLSDATMTACTPSPNALAGVRGSVTVGAESTVDYFFAPIIGFESKVVASSTTVQFGPPESVTGLRPFGLCEDTLGPLAEFAMFTTNPTGYAALADTHDAKIAQIAYGKDDPSACNGGDPVPGNWAMIDLNGGANSAAEAGDWVQNGYGGPIHRDQDYPGDTGAFGVDLNQELQYLVDNEVVFGLPLFSHADFVGATAYFHISGFVAVQIIDFKATGPQDGRYIDLVFRETILDGVCCDNDVDLDTWVRVIQICATDATDPTAACAT